jgi:hypothetical protein
VPNPKDTAMNAYQGADRHAVLDFIPRDTSPYQLCASDDSVRSAGQRAENLLDCPVFCGHWPH